jgi:hypothetical protein
MRKRLSLDIAAHPGVADVLPDVGQFEGLQCVLGLSECERGEQQKGEEVAGGDGHLASSVVETGQLVRRSRLAKADAPSLQA